MIMPTSNDGVSLWQDEAKCRGSETSQFFAESNREANKRKQFCNDCPVRSDCLEYALIYNMSGVWGGTTDKDRAKVSPINKKMLRDDYMESGLYNQRLRA